jgi:hypothetical protein
MKQVKHKQEGLKLNDLSQVILYADDLNLLAKNINITKNIADIHLQASKQIV